MPLPQPDTFFISSGLDSYKDIRILCKMQFKLMAGYDAVSINKETTPTASLIPVLIKKYIVYFTTFTTVPPFYILRTVDYIRAVFN